MDFCFTDPLGKQFQAVGTQVKGFFYESSFQEARPIPVATVLTTAVSWILAVIPMRFGFPWSAISYASGYVAIFLTALMTIKAVGLDSRLSPTAKALHKIGFRPAPCPTCEIFSEFTGNFSDMPSNLEAIYIEHLAREHAVEP